MKHLITAAVAFAAAAAYVAYKNRKTIEIEIKAEQPAKPEEAPVAKEPTKSEEDEKAEEPAKEEALKEEKPAKEEKRAEAPKKEPSKNSWNESDYKAAEQKNG